MTDRMSMLHGGYLNEGKVVKRGRYVVRTQDHPWPEAVDEALEVLATRGFRHCPRPVARTDACSVTLTYLPGKALGSPVPQWAVGSGTLIRATRFISGFAVAASGMRPSISKSDWLTVPSQAGDDLVHADPHPTNLVFDRFRRPTGLIDFELAALGPGTLNLVSLIFNWAPLEPVGVTCWRDAKAILPHERIRTMVRYWHSPVSWPELIDACHDFIRWRRDWITTLAELGNQQARRFAGDPEFEGRLAHAITVMNAMGTTRTAS